MLGAAIAPLLAATIHAYPLPVGFTVKPEGETRLTSVARDGTIVAFAQSTDNTMRYRVIRWNAAGDPAVFTPLSVRTVPGQQSSTVAFPQSVAAGADIYVTATGSG